MPKISKIIYFIISFICFSLFDMIVSDKIIKSIETFTQNSFIDFVVIQNTGAAFSILQDSKSFLICFSTLAAVLIVIYTLKNIKNFSTILVFWNSLLLSGICCNLYERISFGYVRDFFKLNFVNFPVFNISDIFINISVLAIVVIIYKQNFSKNNETSN